MPKVEPLSGIDAAWLAMEDETNLMMVSGILTFSQRLPLKKLKEVLRRRFLKFDRFRQRVVQPEIPLAARPLMPAYWEWVENFRLDDHLHTVRLPEPAGRKEFRELVNELMSTPLDDSRPLWEMHLIENFGKGSGLVVRLHHCIADGMALVHVLLSIADADPRGSAAGGAAGTTRQPPSDGASPGPLEALFGRMFSMTGQVTRLTERVVRESLESLSNPARLLELAQEGAGNALAMQRLFLRSDDPQTVFKGPLDVRKVAAWSEALPLEGVKRVKRALGGTVNDVLVSAMAGGLRHYLKRRRQALHGLELRATVPVNLRRKEDSSQMGNCFGLVFLKLPVGVEDPLERLQIVSRRMNKLKSSREAPVIYGLLCALGGVGKEVQQPLVNLVGAKATAVMTNMMGPPVPLYLAGHEVDEIMFWVPQSARLGLGVSILSYNGKVRLGVATDESLVPDPEKIVEGFHREYKALSELAAAAPEDAGSRAEEERPRRKKASRPKISSRAAAARRKVGKAAPRGSRAGMSVPQQCQAQTQKGTRCRNRVPGGEDLCHVHRKKA